MTLRMTKEDYKLLLSIYAEGLNSIILKKTYNISLPEEYNFNKYFELLEKLATQGLEQNIISENTNPLEANLLVLSEKIEKEKITQKEIIKNLFLELKGSKLLVYLIENFKKDIFEKE